MHVACLYCLGALCGDVTARGIVARRGRFRGLSHPLTRPPPSPCRSSPCSHVRRLRQPLVRDLCDGQGRRRRDRCDEARKGPENHGDCGPPWLAALGQYACGQPPRSAFDSALFRLLHDSFDWPIQSRGFDTQAQDKYFKYLRTNAFKTYLAYKMPGAYVDKGDYWKIPNKCSLGHIWAGFLGF
jgi:hypothetical protein